MALHLHKVTAQHDPVVNPEHMTPEHRKYLHYNAEDFISWAEAVGRNASAVVRHFLTNGKEAEQGYKACAGLTRLTGRYGARRLETACARVLEITATPTIRSISTLLKTIRGDKTTSTPSVEKSNRYGITRGASYFGKGGTRND